MTPAKAIQYAERSVFNAVAFKAYKPLPVQKCPFEEHFSKLTLMSAVYGARSKYKTPDSLETTSYWAFQRKISSHAVYKNDIA